eukprot:444469_1
MIEEEKQKTPFSSPMIGAPSPINDDIQWAISSLLSTLKPGVEEAQMNAMNGIERVSRYSILVNDVPQTIVKRPIEPILQVEEEEESEYEEEEKIDDDDEKHFLSQK